MKSTSIYSFVSSHMFWKPSSRSVRYIVLYKYARRFSQILFLLEVVAFIVKRAVSLCKIFCFTSFLTIQYQDLQGQRVYVLEQYKAEVSWSVDYYFITLTRSHTPSNESDMNLRLGILYWSAHSLQIQDSHINRTREAPVLCSFSGLITHYWTLNRKRT